MTDRDKILSLINTGEMDRIKMAALLCESVGHNDILVAFRNLAVLSRNWGCFNVLFEDKIESVIFHFVNLGEIIINENHKGSFPKEILLLRKLKCLYIENNILANFPAKLDEFTNLRELGITENELKFVPSLLGSLESLEYLDLSSNKIKELPDWIGQLSNLKSLNLSNNDFKYSPNIDGLNNLRVLSMKESKMTELNSSIIDSPSLKELDLRGSDVSLIQEEIYKLRCNNVHVLEK